MKGFETAAFLHMLKNEATLPRPIWGHTRKSPGKPNFMIQNGLYLFSTVSWEEKNLKYIVQLGHNFVCLPSVAGVFFMLSWAFFI